MTAPDLSLSAYFTQHHREADSFWAEVENAVVDKDPARVSGAFSRFDRSIRKHFLLEEEVLFPEFEKVTGSSQGPTMVMMAEHLRVRALLDQMQTALDAVDHDSLMDVGDTLMTFVQQHNMKEEAMLYRMCEQMLGGQWEALYERLRSYL
ncbi:MAG TPA: hemerythrin domain-containing protein [Polyangiales bacterium]